MKKEIEELKRLVASLGDEVRRLKAVQPTVIHYHYPNYYWPSYVPPRPYPIWWSTTSGANQSVRIGTDSFSGTSVTNAVVPFTFTNTSGGAG